MVVGVAAAPVNTVWIWKVRERERVMKGKRWNEIEKERGMTKEMSADSKLFLSNILL